jgi:hypothetical protein
MAVGPNRRGDDCLGTNPHRNTNWPTNPIVGDFCPNAFRPLPLESSAIRTLTRVAYAEVGLEPHLGTARPVSR